MRVNQNPAFLWQGIFYNMKRYGLHTVIFTLFLLAFIASGYGLLSEIETLTRVEQPPTKEDVKYPQPPAAKSIARVPESAKGNVFSARITQKEEHQLQDQETFHIKEELQELPKASKEEQIQATLVINSQSHTLELSRESTVQDMLVKAQEKELITFKGRNFGSGLGFFVEAINGIEQNQQDNHYWIYYINGKKATQGSSSYKLQNGDVIAWQYEEAES